MLKDGDKPYKPVYLHLNNATVETVLRDVALSSGAELTRNDDGSYFLHPPAPTPAPAPAACASPLLPLHVPAVETAVPLDLEWHKLVLTHAIPSEIMALGRLVRQYTRGQSV